MKVCLFREPYLRAASSKVGIDFFFSVTAIGSIPFFTILKLSKANSLASDNAIKLAFPKPISLLSLETDLISYLWSFDFEKILPEQTQMTQEEIILRMKNIVLLRVIPEHK